ncbi:GNAT family N-acetyltransferase [Curtobacterium sp. 1544]|uniref:GNAT family N-acetyltransferase n=1 Tax=Curtobacterium sp. 1544 TaxID=3156417 RepID=UPI003390993A
MTVAVSTPTVSELGAVVRTLRSWQRDDAVVQLHPGDLGWAWRHGPDAVGRAVRTWEDDGQIVAVGFLDGPSTLRMTVAPERWTDPDLARALTVDASDPSTGVLPSGPAAIEVPDGTALREALHAAGWGAGEAWSPLSLDLSEPVVARGPALHVEVVPPGDTSDFTAVHRSAWDNGSFTNQRWTEMSAGAPFAEARCLLGRDDAGVPVAGITVWSAGPGRPGLIEPLGVHADHRGKGHGTAMCVAAAALLRELGASVAWVCTPSDLDSAVATYRSAGFTAMPERLDCVRTR